MSCSWIKAACLPCDLYKTIFLPNGVNKDHYIAIRGYSIWKYNVYNDSWSKIMDVTQAIDDWYGTATALSNDKNDLYVYTNKCQPKLTHIKLENKTYKTFNVKLKCEPFAQMVTIDNVLNIIGSQHNNMHSKWNEKEKQFKGDIIMYNKAKISGHGLIYTNTPKKHLLLFGGFDDNKCSCVDYGLEFDFRTKKWNKLPIQLPPKWKVSCTLAIRNKFAFIIGGIGTLGIRNQYSNDIHIYNIRNKTMQLSKIKLPYKGIWRCITINDELKDEMIVFGFVRQVWKISSIDNYLFPPHYLLKIMHLYYLNEFIYILHRDSGEHWKMNTLDMLQV